MVRRAPVTGGLAGGVAVLGLSPTRTAPGGETAVQETGGTTDTRIGKLDQLYNIRWRERRGEGSQAGRVTCHNNQNKQHSWGFIWRYKLEHNQISRSEVDKSEIFDLLNLYLGDPDQEIQHTALQLIQVVLVVHTRTSSRIQNMHLRSSDTDTWRHSLLAVFRKYFQI